MVPQEQVWGWDYIQDYFVANFGSSFEGAFFSVGSGGGVSSYWPAPYYQQGYAGMRDTEPGQALTFTTATGTQVLLTLPADFAGRNVPDLAADADPYTGYLLLCTVCDPSQPLQSGWGGTSFVAPQMNGVAALVKQRTGGRVGLWNPMLYRHEHKHGAALLVDITAGDNWYYSGVPGYEPAAGVGTLDANAFANAVARGE